MGDDSREEAEHFAVRSRLTLIAAISRTGLGVISMLWTIAVILLVLWILGFSFHIAGGLIHLLLVIALIVGLIQLFTGRRVV